MSAKSPRPAPRREPARLYLLTPPVDDAAAFAPKLQAALADAGIAAVLLRLAPADERTAINHVKALTPMVQETGAALLLDGLPDLVARSGADGAHLTGVEALQAALPALKPARIAGAGGLQTRHDAMLAAEAGADYVMFGEPDAEGRRPSFDAVAERIAWWAEVFEVPCVGYAESPEEAVRLAALGADFVAIGAMIWTDSPAADLVSLAERLASVEPVA
jgi:thiamine-phosphate pyrophosphorylase